jgi:serine/threonine protein phosphatase 1
VSAKKRTLFVGDIHGCYNELQELLHKIAYNPANDRLISLGDLLHKGPMSAEVIKFFYNSKIEVIMGNHDWHFLQALKGNIAMYKEAEKIMQLCGIPQSDMIKWLEEFPYYIKEQSFIAVHACFDPSKSKYAQTSFQDMINGRYFDAETNTILKSVKSPNIYQKPWYQAYPPKSTDRTVVFGHWAKPEPRFFKNFRCIDTGCCYGGRLSCLILPDDNIISVESHQPKKFNY